MSPTSALSSSPWSGSSGRQCGSYWRRAAARIAASLRDRCRTPGSDPSSAMRESYAGSLPSTALPRASVRPLDHEEGAADRAGQLRLLAGELEPGGQLLGHLHPVGQLEAHGALG